MLTTIGPESSSGLFLADIHQCTRQFDRLVGISDVGHLPGEDDAAVQSLGMHVGARQESVDHLTDRGRVDVDVKC